MSAAKIDEAFASLADNVSAYTDLAGRFEATVGAERVVVTAEEITIETPIEISLVVRDDGVVTLGCAPPLYAVDVSIAPVLHTLRFTATAEKRPPEASDG